MTKGRHDVAIIGSGPNGLAAAVTMARAGLSVCVYERADTIGGGTRTAELTLPGFWHDVCSAVHPQALASPFFRAFQLTKRVDFVVPELSYAHPLDGGRAALAYRDLDRTANELGRDGAAWARLLRPLLNRLPGVEDFTGHQLLRLPRDPIAAAWFGARSLEQGGPAWNARFSEEAARALFTGVAAHASTRQPSLAGAGAGLLLAVHAHARGWPFPVGGSQSIANALAADLVAHGGEIVLNSEVTSLADVDGARVTIFDTSARDLVRIVGHAVPERYRKRVNAFRYGTAVAKADFALSGPVPWSNADVGRAGTVHLGGTRAEIRRAETAVQNGLHADSPYVLVTQPSGFDSTRAPDGKHVLWAYTHVPRHSQTDQLEAITKQIERFAPGFRDLILASVSQTAVQVEGHNPNYVGGDISSGAVSLRQLAQRPVLSTNPWRTPVKGVYLCSAGVAPGPSVHGMGGWFAARAALHSEFGIYRMPRLSRD